MKRQEPAPRTRPDGYILAASVIDTFEPGSLRPAEGFEGDLGELLQQAVMSERADGKVEWRLPNDVRRPALQWLARWQRLHATLQASRAATKEDSPYQEMFERYVNGKAKPLEHQNLVELQASLNAVKLLDDLVPGLPDPEAIRAALVLRDFVAQFELLGGDHFVGRAAEMRMLREFVDVLPVGIFDTVRRGSAQLLGRLGIHRILYQAPLMITGMGGMGKSALLSHFVLEHLQSSDATADLLFAYVDFDRPGIWPDQPLTVLAEIAQQLALQVPRHAEDFRRLYARIVSELAYISSPQDDYQSLEAMGNLGTDSENLTDFTLSEFARLCQFALGGTTHQTLLLVLDTFEEVSQRSAHHQELLLRFVGNLQRILPKLRVVISGRGMHSAEVDGDPDDDRFGIEARDPTDLIGELTRMFKPLELKELTDEDPYKLLESLGSPRRALNEAIVRRVGGHPLSLKLAAQLVSTVAQKLKKPADQLTSKEVFGGSEWLDHMNEGMLYRRIVSHLPDPQMQKLANPGLVLRELTADILFCVLDEPCELNLGSLGAADQLFERLKQFNQLVSVQSASVVRHRPELRERVLREMMHGQRALCRDIWSRAVAYYEEGDKNRTEEMYCRLMLDYDTQTLSGRWSPGLEKKLLKSRGELPVRARQFLDLMALIADGGTAQDRLLTGDLNLALVAEEMKLLLSRGSAKEALDLFRATHPEQAPRYDSVLYALRVRAMAQNGELQPAMSLALTGLDRLVSEGKENHPRYEDLLLLCCQITRAQHAAKAGTLLLKIRKRLLQIKPLQASRLLPYFDKLNFDSDRPVQILRIAVALLELFGVEETSEPSAGWASRSESFPCSERGMQALHRLAPQYTGVDGGLLVRALALLSANFPKEPELANLLTVPQAMAVLHRDYAAVLRTHLDKYKPDLPKALIEKLKSWTVEKSTRFQLGPLEPYEMSEIGRVLRAVIQERDTTQISSFA